MKRKLSLTLALLLTTAIVACGSESNTSGTASEGTAPTEANSEAAPSSEEKTKAPSEEKAEEVAAPLDLTGLWVQEDHGETYMTATIRDDGLIGVFFVLEGDETPYTYWVGTYEAPTEATDKYSWTSESTYAGNGILASSDSQKDFKYEKEKITYTVTMQGESKDVSLIREDWDVSKIPDSAFGSVKMESADFKDLEIKDSGWCVNHDYLFYYVTLYNPNEDIAVEFPSFRITARDENNALIDTTDQTLSIIYPGAEFTYGSQAFSVEDAAPNSVDFEMLEVADYNLKRASSLDEYKQLEVVNAAAREEKIVGEINNPNDYSIDTVYVLAICRDSADKVSAIESTFVDDVKANGSTPFSISSYSGAEIASAVFYANQW